MKKKNIKSSKRGRPSVFDESRLARTKFVFSEVRTKRGLQNNTYALECVQIIRNKVKPETLEYFYSEKSMKTSILSELGRLAMSLYDTNLTTEEVEEVIVESAENLYVLHKEHGFNVKGLVGVCRDKRLGR